MMYPKLSVARYIIKFHFVDNWVLFWFFFICFVRRNSQIRDIHEKCTKKEQIYLTFENKRSLTFEEKNLSSELLIIQNSLMLRLCRKQEIRTQESCKRTRYNSCFITRAFRDGRMTTEKSSRRGEEAITTQPCGRRELTQLSMSMVAENAKAKWYKNT